MFPTKLQFIWQSVFRGEGIMWKVNGLQTTDETTDDGRQVMASDSKSSLCLWEGELKTSPPVFTYLLFRHFLMSSSTAHLFIINVFFFKLIRFKCVFPSREYLMINCFFNRFKYRNCIQYNIIVLYNFNNIGF